MSRNELLDAYQQGRISRRTFVKGMAALGFSVTVANVLADRVRAAGSANRGINNGDTYDDAYAYDDVYGGGAAGGGAVSGGGTTTSAAAVALPSTGSGSKSGSSWMAPVAIVGAGAAAAAAYLRKKTGEVTTE